MVCRFNWWTRLPSPRSSAKAALEVLRASAGDRRSTMWGDELTPCYGIIPLIYWYTTGISSGKCVFCYCLLRTSQIIDRGQKLKSWRGGMILAPPGTKLSNGDTVCISAYHRDQCWLTLCFLLNITVPFETCRWNYIKQHKNHIKPHKNIIKQHKTT